MLVVCFMNTCSLLHQHIYIPLVVDAGGFLTRFMKALAAFWGVLAGKHIRWTNHVNFLLCMVIFHGFISVCANRSLLEIILAVWHWWFFLAGSFEIHLCCVLFSRVCVNVHTSELYLDVCYKYCCLEFFTDILVAENRFECLVVIISSLFHLWCLLWCQVVIQDICIFPSIFCTSLYVIPFGFAFIYM